MVNVQSPFVVKLFWTFQSKYVMGQRIALYCMLIFFFALLRRRNLFLVMEYLPGGDFMSLLECIVQLEEQVSIKQFCSLPTKIFKCNNLLTDKNIVNCRWHVCTQPKLPLH